MSILAFPLGVFASPEQSQNPQEEESFTDVIMHHISDSHEYHLLDWQGTPVTLPLPIILWTENGLVTFLSSEFHHDDKGEVIVEKKGLYFVRVHGQIHYTDANGTLSYNNDHKLENPRPLDFSITKNVVLLFLIALIMFLAFTAVARSYKKNPKAPKGFANLLETLVVFVRDDIAVPNIGNHKYERYMPYLLTVFFLILIGNLLGLVPIISGTLTNDIVLQEHLLLSLSLLLLLAGTETTGNIFLQHQGCLSG